MCDEWLENMDNGKLNGVVFLDIKKAFDSINHHILLNKMNEQFGIFGKELKWFQSYLTNREQHLLMENYLAIKLFHMECLRGLYWGHSYFCYV